MLTTVDILLVKGRFRAGEPVMRGAIANRTALGPTGTPENDMGSVLEIDV